MNIKFLKKVGIAAVVGIAIAVAASAPASAQTLITQLETTNPGTVQYEFTNSTGLFTQIGSYQPVNFVFDTANSYGGANAGPETVAAYVTINGVATTGAQYSSGFHEYDQPLSSLTIDVFTNTANIAGSTIFTSTSGAGSLTFDGENSTIDINATTTTPGSVVNYSPYIDASLLTDPQDVALAFGEASPGLITTGLNAGTSITNGFLNSFQADGTGTFGATSSIPTNPQLPGVPEPSPATAIGVAVASLGCLLMASRRRSSLSL